MLFLKILAFVLAYVMCGMIMLLFALLTNEGKHKGINFETAEFSDCAFFVAFFPFYMVKYVSVWTVMLVKTIFNFFKNADFKHLMEL